MQIEPNAAPDLDEGDAAEVDPVVERALGDRQVCREFVYVDQSSSYSASALIRETDSIGVDHTVRILSAIVVDPGGLVRQISGEATDYSHKASTSIVASSEALCADNLLVRKAVFLGFSFV